MANFFTQNIAKVTGFFSTGGPIVAGLFSTGKPSPVVPAPIARPVFGGVKSLFPPITHQPILRVKPIQHPATNQAAKF